MELREKIARLIDAAGLYDTDTSPGELASQILAVIKEAGYRKVTGEPPLLTNEEIAECYRKPKFPFPTAVEKTIAQAQVAKIKRWLQPDFVVSSVERRFSLKAVSTLS